MYFAKTTPWGDPTCFIERIWKGFLESPYMRTNFGGESALVDYLLRPPCSLNFDGIYRSSSFSKLHSLRVDIAKRWNPDNHIHFKVWEGRPYHSNSLPFAPIIPCVSVQKVFINWGLTTNFLHRFPCMKISKKDLEKPLLSRTPSVYVDEKLLSPQEVGELANNDGFDNVTDFYRWFNKDFSGKIIHWTDKIY